MMKHATLNAPAAQRLYGSLVQSRIAGGLTHDDLLDVAFFDVDAQQESSGAANVASSERLHGFGRKHKRGTRWYDLELRR